MISKAGLVAILLGKLGISHTLAYDTVNALVGAGHVREIKKDRQKMIVMVRESLSP